jgi:hypothetical protein
MRNFASTAAHHADKEVGIENTGRTSPAAQARESGPLKLVGQRLAAVLALKRAC